MDLHLEIGVYFTAMNITTYIFASGLAFLIGSFPTAFILVKYRSGKDLRNEGSGNIGTLNAYEVSRSRVVGILVLLIDVLKGAVPIAAVYMFFDRDATLAVVVLLSVVAGHNYSPWLRFKGGRGLASALGATVLFNPLLFVYWGAFWLAGYLKTRDVHFGNIAATALAPFLVLAAPGLARWASLFPCTGTELVAASFLLCGLIFLRHIDPLKQLLNRKRAQ